MGRGATKAAQGQLGAENTASQQFGNKANDVYNQLFPELQQQYSNPSGYGQADLNAINTASQQSLGGALSSEKGEAANRAARTRNIGSSAPLLDSATEGAMKQGSQNALGVQEANANLKAKQQGAALAGEQGLYGTNTQAMLNALGMGNSSLNAWNQADANTTGSALGWAKLGINTATESGNPFGL